MIARLWRTACAVALLALPATSAVAQRNSPWPMVVVMRLNDGKDPWQFAPRMAAATGMQLVGVSNSTNTAVFTVPNETDKSQGIVAQRNQKTVMDGFPGVIMSYNYGLNYPSPKDIQKDPPPIIETRRPPDDNRGYDNRRGNDNRRGARFSDRDRVALRDWYYGRRDTWVQVREGMTLDARLRELSYPAPPDLERALGPVYRGGRYLVIGDNLVLVDSRDYVLDVIRFSEIRDDRRR